MKIRTGFVSNSSSSSFVIFGFDISENQEARKRFEELTGFNIERDGSEIDGSTKLRKSIGVKKVTFRLGHSESGIREGAEVLGLLISQVSSDDCGEDIELSLEDIGKDLMSIAEKVGLSIKEARLFAGTMVS